MNVLLILAQAAVEPEPSVFSFSTSVSFWTLVIFGVLLLVLAKYAFPPILGYAEAREKRIQATLDDARRLQAESERQLEEQRQHMAEARQHAQQVLAEARQVAERLRQELLERAKAEQEEIIARAHEEIERERERAVEAVRREAVDLALGAASRLIERRLGSDQDRALVTEFLSSVDGAGAARRGVRA